MAFLWDWAGVAFPIAGIYPEDFDTLQAKGMGIAGAPETVRRYIASTVEATGITYFVADMVFGHIPFDATDSYASRLGYVCGSNRSANLLETSERILGELDRGI